MNMMLIVKLIRGQAEREFKVEVETIGRVRHKNLVRLLGYCAEGAHRYFPASLSHLTIVIARLYLSCLHLIEKIATPFFSGDAFYKCTDNFLLHVY